jgi:ribosomal-protein-serine acetyltransferase
LSFARDAFHPPATVDVPDTLPLSEARALRVLQESDLDELHALIEANRSHLAKWLPWAAEQTRETTLEFIRATRVQIAQNNGFQAAILDAGRVVGVIGFHGIDWQHRSTSIGYWLASEAQGRGTMTQALRAMVHHALGGWGLNRVEIRASVENERSRALIERLGFEFEGVARQAFRLKDGYHDDAVYSMLRADWPWDAEPGGTLQA